jgi:hypothetical protein
MKRREFLKLSIAGTITVLLDAVAISAQAQTTMVLKASDVHPAG